MQNILVIANQKEVFEVICQNLSSECNISKKQDIYEALQALQDLRHDIIFVELDQLLTGNPPSPDEDLLDSLNNIYPPLYVVVITPQNRIRQAIRILKKGASDYIICPINPEEIQLVSQAAREAVLKELEINYLRDQFWRSESLSVVRTENPLMQQVYQKVRSVAPSKATVLLIGETGTGKSFLARLIHQHSNRQNDQFISVHCGAIPDTLLESELFGHEKGSFTGAHRKKLGKFEIANGGTIFLDEIATLTPAAQIKLLQILQEKTFSRVGGEDTIKVDTRIIAATNADLKEMSAGGQFRKDLYYRLNVFPIELPPLRKRPEDIPRLVKHFLQKLNQEYGKQIQDAHPRTLGALKNYQWPGNIRELENLIERAFILESTSTLTPENFPDELFEGEYPTSPLTVDTTGILSEARRKVVEDFERHYLIDLFTRNKGKVKLSAEEAGITPRQLNKLMLKYNIRKEDYKTR
jgi:DNA-binding NtrC family response regulator